jgi:hypothetical protein
MKFEKIPLPWRGVGEADGVVVRMRDQSKPKSRLLELGGVPYCCFTFQNPKGIPLHWRGGFHPPKADEIWGGVPFCRFVFQTPVSLRLTPPLERGLGLRNPHCGRTKFAHTATQNGRARRYPYNAILLLARGIAATNQ